MTTTTYDANTGRIYDADIEFNEQHFVFDTAGATDRYDLQSVVAHEAGHVLGLDHSEFWDATMYGHINAGELDKRDLEPDDVAGLCSIYAPGGGCDCGAASGGGWGLGLFFSAWLLLRPRR